MRRHKRVALVTGVQTCALPIFPGLEAETIGEMAALPVAVVGSQGSREFFGLGRAVEFFREGRCKCITRQIALHMSAALVVGEGWQSFVCKPGAQPVVLDWCHLPAGTRKHILCGFELPGLFGKRGR